MLLMNDLVVFSGKSYNFQFVEQAHYRSRKGTPDWSRQTREWRKSDGAKGAIVVCAESVEAYGGNLIAGKGRYIDRVIEFAAINPDLQRRS